MTLDETSFEKAFQLLKEPLSRGLPLQPPM